MNIQKLLRKVAILCTFPIAFAIFLTIVLGTLFAEALKRISEITFSIVKSLHYLYLYVILWE